MKRFIIFALLSILAAPVAAAPVIPVVKAPPGQPPAGYRLCDDFRVILLPVPYFKPDWRSPLTGIEYKNANPATNLVFKASPGALEAPADGQTLSFAHGQKSVWLSLTAGAASHDITIDLIRGSGVVRSIRLPPTDKTFSIFFDNADVDGLKISSAAEETSIRRVCIAP